MRPGIRPPRPARCPGGPGCPRAGHGGVPYPGGGAARGVRQRGSAGRCHRPAQPGRPSPGGVADYCAVDVGAQVDLDHILQGQLVPGQQNRWPASPFAAPDAAGRPTAPVAHSCNRTPAGAATPMAAAAVPRGKSAPVFPDRTGHAVLASRMGVLLPCGLQRCGKPCKVGACRWREYGRRGQQTRPARCGVARVAQVPGRYRPRRPSAAEREQALARLHQLLLRAAHAELRRRSPVRIEGRERDDLAHQDAGDALLAITGKLDRFRGDSRFTT